MSTPLLKLVRKTIILVTFSTCRTTKSHTLHDVSYVTATVPYHTQQQTSPRYWPQYGGNRHVELLDGLWNMSQLGSIDHPPTDFDSMDPSLDPSTITTTKLVWIPSCVDNTPPGYLGYRGVTFFRRTFRANWTMTTSTSTSTSTTVARIQFQACSFYCRVWINGQEIGDHRAGGYVAFSLDVPPLLPTNNNNNNYNNYNQTSLDHEIFVLVDNRFNDTTAPVHTGGDFWHYGGIMRSVELHSMPPTEETLWPWRLYVFPLSLSTVHLKLRLTGNYYGEMKDDIWIGFDKGRLQKYSGFAINCTVDLGTVRVPNPRVWSTIDPQLHTVQVQLNGAVIIERFGLRIFAVDATTHRVTLNGEILKLVGWNHHTQWPQTAASPSDQQLDHDIQLLVQGGANYVRGAHYPQDPRWLDRLDEYGMVMWCETLGPGVTAKHAQDPYFLKYQAQQMYEMLGWMHR